MHPDDLIGATLGSYRVTAKLGQGGMGAVYLAEHPALGRKAAVKVLLAELSSHAEAVDRFFHEARTTANLRHPALVDVFDFGTLPDGRAFLVMDFLEGESLQSRLEKVRTLPLPQALELIRQIALGMSAAHAEKIVHRDLKPDNVFLLPPVAGGGGERVKILDFGIAKLTRKEGNNVAVTRTGMLLGTPLYMSPEQCRGTGDIDHRADIYSLGCILFTMLAGRPPFVSEGMGELLGMHLHAPAPTLAEVGVSVPPEIETLVARTLAKAPGDRFATMIDLAEAITPLIANADRATKAGAPVVNRTAILPGGSMVEPPRMTGGASGTKILDAGPSRGTSGLPAAVGRSTLSELAHADEPRKTAGRGGNKTALGVGITVALVAAGAGIFFAVGRTPEPARPEPPAAAVRPAEPPRVEPTPQEPVPQEAPPRSREPAAAISEPAPANEPSGKKPRLPSSTKGAAAPAETTTAETPSEKPEESDKRGDKRRPSYGRTKLNIEKQTPYD